MSVSLSLCVYVCLSDCVSVNPSLHPSISPRSLSQVSITAQGAICALQRCSQAAPGQSDDLNKMNVVKDAASVALCGIPVMLRLYSLAGSDAGSQ